jgi:hypothetical protein
MSIIIASAKTKVEFTITFSLTKGEAQALDAIAGYGADPFLEVFYPKMGKAYLQPHEQEMRNLFYKIKTNLSKEISKIDKAEAKIKEATDLF